MAWSKKKTFRILLLVLSLSFVFMVSNIVLVVLNLRHGGFNYFKSSFISFLATIYGTGIGCICFRLSKSEAKWPHAIIHTVTPCAMIGGQRLMFSVRPPVEIFHWFSINILAIIAYLIQIILSFHFMIFRYGKTPKEKAFRAGMHAFLGALVFFICVMDGLLSLHMMILINRSVNEYTYISSLCLLFYAMCTWYIILNPYFDWRRLAIMSRKEEIGRSSSKSSLRSSLHQGGRSPLRSESRR